MGSGHTHRIRITQSRAKKELGYKYSLKIIFKRSPIKRIAKWKGRDVKHASLQHYSRRLVCSFRTSSTHL